MQVAKPKSSPAFSLTDLREVVLRWLEFEDPEIIDVIMAIYVANNLSTDPSRIIHNID